MNDAASPPDVSPLPTQPATQRLMSLDALRGFDMFWIVGGDELVHALHAAFPVWPLTVIDGQMDHKAWQGVAFYDLIFPLFVFIVGVSLVFSLGRMLERDGLARTIRRIVVRSLVLYAFGLIQYGGVAKGFDHVRWMGVLQRIAICYLVTGTLFCLVRNCRALVGICASLLVAYWALLTFVPIRDFNLETKHLKALNLKPGDAETMARFENTTNFVRGKFDDGLNLTQQIDFRFLPGRKWDGAYDPEGILSTLPAVATCLLGVFAGMLLQNRNMREQEKVYWLVGSGVIGVLLGFLWGLQFPVIKKIWTSSYVLVAGGYSCLFLAAFYEVVEVWGWLRWCTPFLWIGMNPITIYLAFHLIQFDTYAERLVGGPVQEALGRYGNLLLALVVVAMMFCLVRFLYRRKVFLRL
jgi:predicted acyltransferase